MQVVIARFMTTELTEFDESLIAAHFARGRVVLPFPDVQAEARETGQAELVVKLRSVMGGTWPVFDNLEDLMEVCVPSSASFLAETSVGSHRKVVVFIILDNTFRITVSKKHFISF